MKNFLAGIILGVGITGTILVSAQIVEDPVSEITDENRGAILNTIKDFTLLEKTNFYIEQSKEQSKRTIEWIERYKTCESSLLSQ